MSPIAPGSRVVIVHAKPWKRQRPITMRTTARGIRDGWLVLERTFSPGGHYDSLGDAKLAGDYGTIEVTEGSWTLRRAYYRANGQLIGELFNIQTPAEFRSGEIRYIDLEVDVVRRPDGTVEIVDEEDLAEAVRVGGITPDLAATARTLAHDLAQVLVGGGDWRSISGPPRSARPAGRSI